MNDFTRISIHATDGGVYTNTDSCINLDFSDCGIPEDIWAFQWENGEGWVEFKDSRDNEKFIGTDFPEWVNNCVQKFIEHDYKLKNPPPPTPEEMASNNKFIAKFLLEESDWAALPDTNLQNQSEWDAYRSALRVIFFNPPQEEITSWPVKPEAIWV
jgi:hypothetical protein